MSCHRRNENPSFSSTLLDVISRSIDEDKSPVYRKRINDVVVRRNTDTGFESSSFYLNSGIASSVCRYGGGKMSSEIETIYGFPTRPKPIRTNISHNNDQEVQQKLDCEGKKKSRAMKIYGYLKKSKQPISPGGRLTTFLISLFSSANTKKSNIQSAYNDDVIHANRKPKSASTSSSATSFSRSCNLSKTPSCSQPLGQKSLIGNRSSPRAVKFGRNLINGEFKRHLTEKNRHIGKTSMNMLKNYQRKVEYVFDSITNNNNNNDYEDDDDEGSSYASSDLFEIDHLSASGMDRCMQELPLYETTSVDANRVIPNGLFV